MATKDEDQVPGLGQGPDPSHLMSPELFDEFIALQTRQWKERVEFEARQQREWLDLRARQVGEGNQTALDPTTQPQSRTIVRATPSVQSPTNISILAPQPVQDSLSQANTKSRVPPPACCPNISKGAKSIDLCDSESADNEDLSDVATPTQIQKSGQSATQDWQAGKTANTRNLVSVSSIDKPRGQGHNSLNDQDQVVLQDLLRPSSISRQQGQSDSQLPRLNEIELFNPIKPGGKEQNQQVVKAYLHASAPCNNTIQLFPRQTPRQSPAKASPVQKQSHRKGPLQPDPRPEVSMNVFYEQVNNRSGIVRDPPSLPRNPSLLSLQTQQKNGGFIRNALKDGGSQIWFPEIQSILQNYNPHSVQRDVELIDRISDIKPSRRADSPVHISALLALQKRRDSRAQSDSMQLETTQCQPCMGTVYDPVTPPGHLSSAEQRSKIRELGGQLRGTWGEKPHPPRSYPSTPPLYTQDLPLLDREMAMHLSQSEEKQSVLVKAKVSKGLSDTITSLSSIPAPPRAPQNAPSNLQTSPPSTPKVQRAISPPPQFKTPAVPKIVFPNNATSELTQRRRMREASIASQNSGFSTLSQTTSASQSRKRKNTINLSDDGSDSVLSRSASPANSNANEVLKTLATITPPATKKTKTETGAAHRKGVARVVKRQTVAPTTPTKPKARMTTPAAPRAPVANRNRDFNNMQVQSPGSPSVRACSKAAVKLSHRANPSSRPTETPVSPPTPNLYSPSGRQMRIAGAQARARIREAAKELAEAQQHAGFARVEDMEAGMRSVSLTASRRVQRRQMGGASEGEGGEDDSGCVYDRTAWQEGYGDGGSGAGRRLIWGGLDVQHLSSFKMENEVVFSVNEEMADDSGSAEQHTECWLWEQDQRLEFRLVGLGSKPPSLFLAFTVFFVFIHPFAGGGIVAGHQGLKLACGPARLYSQSKSLHPFLADNYIKPRLKLIDAKSLTRSMEYPEPCVNDTTATIHLQLNTRYEPFLNSLVSWDLLSYTLRHAMLPTKNTNDENACWRLGRCEISYTRQSRLWVQVALAFFLHNRVSFCISVLRYALPPPPSDPRCGSYKHSYNSQPPTRLPNQLNKVADMRVKSLVNTSISEACLRRQDRIDSDFEYVQY
ncbi:uncharacterized protein BDR25DRAFT_356589 [Lindgomyces ingoldianus]|uniref:Uncharacterized protein n=1 Tax=Lindgomyces ingoldianus TaxID=673940 RepID=A0ACB6QTE4_9PLEO|nr:uncharacterized protein BDR25DRAFT_356589 [Lindgomyces ingoldianus]KAF2469357.1 hypothetical protein BDR25DRAFT_356589 [Lindgomyces ingoldianus]